MSESFNTTGPNGDELTVHLPDEAAIERLALALAASGAKADDRADARERVTDAQRGLARQFLILSMNSGA